MRRFAQAVDSVLADREILRQNVDNIVRDFIEYQRRHVMMEDRDFFPAALNALEPQDWTEIASALTSHEDPLFSEAAEETFDWYERISCGWNKRPMPKRTEARFSRLTNGWNAVLAFANCGRAVVHIRGSYVPHSDVGSYWCGFW